MSLYAVVALYPLWAVSVLFAATAVRLGREEGRGLVALSATMALWVSGLVLLEHPDTRSLAERVLPCGMLMAGSFAHAGLDAADLGLGPRRRALVLGVAYGFGILVGAVGAAAPELYLAPGLSGPGPLFWPLFAVAAAGSAATILAMGVGALRAKGAARRRLAAITLGCVFGTAGGGATVTAHVLGAGDMRAAGPLLYPAIGLVTWAVLDAQPPEGRALFRRALGYATITGAVSAIGLPLFVLAAPRLAPEATLGWLALVSFAAALPLDAIRNLVVEGVGRRLYRDPIGVPDLAKRAEESETRADHAEALAQIGTMASAVAHEIRNPIGVIQAQAKLLERTGARPESVAALREQVERMKRFLDDLLRYAKPRPLERIDVALEPALEKSIAEVRTQSPGAGEASPAIELEVPAGLQLVADPHALSDVLVVLVSNAVAACWGREGATIRVRAGREGDGVELTVTDDGPGVPKELEGRLFEPFVSGRGRDHPVTGTGLGLAIAGRWIERHGGAIRHERPDGGGARFVTWWPDEG